MTRLSAPRTFLPFSGAATRWANAGTLPANGPAHRPPATRDGRACRVLLHECPYSSSERPNAVTQVYAKAKELLSARVSARANPAGADGAGSGSGARRTSCSDTELCAEGDAAGIPRCRAFWICRVTRYRSLDNRRIE